MQARVPLDVDLEDRLIYGLSPGRFVFLVCGGLTAMAAWYGLGSPGWLRGLLAAVALAAGALLAWGRLAGRPFDHLLLDLASYAWRNYEVRLEPIRVRRTLVLPALSPGRVRRFRTGFAPSSVLRSLLKVLAAPPLWLGARLLTGLRAFLSLSRAVAGVAGWLLEPLST